MQACLNLPLQPAELALLRNISHHYAMGTEREWGMVNQHRADEVAALFNKLTDMFANVQAA